MLGEHKPSVRRLKREMLKRKKKKGEMFLGGGKGEEGEQGCDVLSSASSMVLGDQAAPLLTQESLGHRDVSPVPRPVGAHRPVPG